MIITLAQTKGGVGKTTLAVNLAIEGALRRQRDILLVDADEQGTAADFSTLRTERLGATGYTAIQLAGAAVRSQVLAMRDKFDDVVIDAGGRDTAGLRAALTVTDIALIPFQPRSFDVWTLDKMAALVTEAKLINPALQALAVINCADAQGLDNREAAETLAECPEICYLDAAIGRRQAVIGQQNESRIPRIDHPRPRGTHHPRQKVMGERRGLTLPAAGPARHPRERQLDDQGRCRRRQIRRPVQRCDARHVTPHRGRLAARCHGIDESGDRLGRRWQRVNAVRSAPSGEATLSASIKGQPATKQPQSLPPRPTKSPRQGPAMRTYRLALPPRTTLRPRFSASMASWP